MVDQIFLGLLLLSHRTCFPPDRSLDHQTSLCQFLLPTEAAVATQVAAMTSTVGSTGQTMFDRLLVTIHLAVAADQELRSETRITACMRLLEAHLVTTEVFLDLQQTVVTLVMIHGLLLGATNPRRSRVHHMTLAIDQPLRWALHQRLIRTELDTCLLLPFNLLVKRRMNYKVNRARLHDSKQTRQAHSIMRTRLGWL